jgi:hypothetical protein
MDSRTPHALGGSGEELELPPGGLSLVDQINEAFLQRIRDSEAPQVATGAQAAQSDVSAQAPATAEMLPGNLEMWSEDFNFEYWQPEALGEEKSPETASLTGTGRADSELIAGVLGGPTVSSNSDWEHIEPHESFASNDWTAAVPLASPGSMSTFLPMTPTVPTPITTSADPQFGQVRVALSSNYVFISTQTPMASPVAQAWPQQTPPVQLPAGQAGHMRTMTFPGSIPVSQFRQPLPVSNYQPLYMGPALYSPYPSTPVARRGSGPIVPVPLPAKQHSLSPHRPATTSPINHFGPIRSSALGHSKSVPNLKQLGAAGRRPLDTLIPRHAPLQSDDTLANYDEETMEDDEGMELEPAATQAQPSAPAKRYKFHDESPKFFDESPHQLHSPSDSRPPIKSYKINAPSGPAQYEAAQNRKTPRHPFSFEELETLERYYASNQQPDMNQRKSLVEEVGGGDRRIAVWFQNRRVKDRTAAEKAGAGADLGS